MKKTLFKHISLALLLTMGLGSCDVDRIPETQLSDPAFWKTERDLQGASNFLYTYLPGLPNTDDNWSDDTYARAPNGISDGTRIAPATDGRSRPDQPISLAQKRCRYTGGRVGI